MTDTKHTPGPWEHAEDMNRDDLDIKEGIRCFVVDQLRPNANGEMRAWQCVARVSGGDTNEECEANARLIAASPKLLAALRGALKALEEVDGRGRYLAEYAKWRDLVKEVDG